MLLDRRETGTLLRLVPLSLTDMAMAQTGHGDGVSHVNLSGVQPLPSDCYSLCAVQLVNKMYYLALNLT